MRERNAATCALHPDGFAWEGCADVRRLEGLPRFGWRTRYCVTAGIIVMKIAVPLWLSAAAAVGVTVEAPIFVAITVLFALVAYCGAALEAWDDKSSRRRSLPQVVIGVGVGSRSAPPAAQRHQG